MKPEKQNNKTAILDKIKESIMSKEVHIKDVENLSKKGDNLDDAAELIEKIERIMKKKIYIYFNVSLSSKYNF